MKFRIIIALVSIILLIVFLIPVGKGIVCTGNAVGILFCSFVLAVCIFFEQFRKITLNLWNKPVGKVLLCAVSAVACICVIYSVVISILMYRQINDPPKNDNTTVIVLGCKVKNGRPSAMLACRLNAAYTFLSEHESVNVIVSGGKGDDELISEAQCMKDYLVSKGISAERIFMEDKSVNTLQNLEFSRNISIENNLPQNFTLITDGYHQFRAEMLAHKLDIHPYNISGYTAWYVLPTYWVREWIGIAYYALFG